MLKFVNGLLQVFFPLFLCVLNYYIANTEYFSHALLLWVIRLMALLGTVMGRTAASTEYLRTVHVGGKL